MEKAIVVCNRQAHTSYYSLLLQCCSLLLTIYSDAMLVKNLNKKFQLFYRSAYIHDRILQAGGRFAEVLAGETLNLDCGTIPQFTTCGSVLQVFFGGKILIFYILPYCIL